MSHHVRNDGLQEVIRRLETSRHDGVQILHGRLHELAGNNGARSRHRGVERPAERPELPLQVGHRRVVGLPLALGAVRDRLLAARAAAVHAAQAESALAKAELSAISGKLNPHFLFNTLNSLIALTRKDAAQAEAALLRFSTMLRYVLDTKRGAEDRVMLSDEIDFLRDGEHVVDVPLGVLDDLQPWSYLANIVRVGGVAYEVYPITLRTRLPKIRVPLRSGDEDAVLDLQAAFNQAWQRGPWRTGHSPRCWSGPAGYAGSTRAWCRAHPPAPACSCTRTRPCADAAAGFVEFAVVPIAVANTLLPTGKIKLIGIAGETKLAGISKDVPLMTQYAKGLNVYGCWNVALPPNTPKEIVEYYRKVVLKSVKTDEYKQFMESNYIFVSKPETVVEDMINLRKQWLPYTSKMAAPN